METLLSESKDWKKKADALINKTQIVEDLSRFGKVYLQGAYSGDVMMHGDLDFCVVRQEPYTSEEIVEILGQFYKESKFRSYFVKGDWDDPRLGNEFPNGHYMGMKIRDGKDKWVFDIWFISEKEYKERGNFFQIENVNLAPEQKKKILKLKKQRNERSISVSGQDIYKAVLEKGVSDISELKNEY